MSKFEVADGAPTGIVIHKRQADGSIKKFSADKKAATVKLTSPEKSAAKVAVARAQNRRTVSLAQPRRADVDLSSHVPGEPYRYKHGWIPLAGAKVHLHKTSLVNGESQGKVRQPGTHTVVGTGRNGDVIIKHDEFGTTQHAHPSDLEPAETGREKVKRVAKEYRAVIANARAETQAKIVGPSDADKIKNAEIMYGSDRSKWSVAGLKSAVKMGDTKSSAELLKRANKRGVEKVTAKNASQISGQLKSAKPSSVDRRKK